MNSVPELMSLMALTQAKYDQQQQSFQKLVSEENRLRAELARLDAAAHLARSTPNGEKEMRAIGADIIWQGWVVRKKTQLNLKLAQVLALKQHHLAQVKNAYGKVIVVKELLIEAQAAMKNGDACAGLAQAIDFALHKPS